ncbi:MAG: sel1 repeat family protein [Comamonas sp.]
MTTRTGALKAGAAPAILGAVLLGLPLAVLAQQVSPPPAQAAQAPSASTAARFVASCNDSLERGVTELGCQAPLYRNELERLKREALNTQNPQLLSFVGDAYRNPRSGMGDMGQAYRWYLLAAVRGDPLAMQRLAEMNQKGQGVPKDNVKALGYARLAERLALPGSGAKRNEVQMINELGNEMAAEEVALAESFADQLQARIRRESAGETGGAAAAAGTAASPAPRTVPVPAPRQVPGSGAATPGTVLPGVPAPLPHE